LEYKILILSTFINGPTHTNVMDLRIVLVI
jgi:glycerate-2-kinase